ncbi:unnamed protein product [Protopolystoma xenopodis]|uniref:Protein MEMO1 n=1 Tax=Protopolystoma xenopodis TaxID=117903 RepID=A0A448X175_9PLAT|nr:unnamed protein product [Protopolystoma xenopodis]
MNPEREAVYGKIFARYLADPENLFIISSDFCHWGKRFHYTSYDKRHGDIWKSIKALDHTGMQIIESMNPSAFSDYLQDYRNTICGRHPIGILLNAIETLRSGSNDSDGNNARTLHGAAQQFSLKFLQYAQSGQCQNMDDSSVSYAAASLVIQ